ncbi:hypothetical protein U0A51_15780 [Escherichia coli]|nr:hypothetical protein [Escherichia coli]
MSTITRERIAQYANDPLMCNVNDEVRQMARIALVSLEAEPVAYADPQAFRNFQAGVARREWMWRSPGEDLIPLYAAPPAASADEDLLHMAASAIEDLLSNKERSGAGVWSDIPGKLRRAAMLQSFGNSEQLNSPVIQDGSEDTKRLDWLEAQNKRLNEYYGTTYGWKFDANFQRNAMMLNDSNYPVMTVRQAIDEAIAAAPQQEVKS